ncbi:hypothetical protein DSO57_1001939 [Entomophthora muscae]|uniref:Uncharacterized protein n=1 Tax=Entomophthora muscae TaxID=34485 RepID=A0ACC2UV27_9FUNG|nr:hypothetical protein DSO57_1001939 [Entomophthora muscae]
MDEENTPKEIAALKKRVHQKVLDGDKRWAVPALPRPCPKVTGNVKTHEKFSLRICFEKAQSSVKS